MRFLHTSDWHLGKSLYEFSLLEDQAFFLDNLYSLLQEEAIEALVIAGDIYDRAMPSSEAVELYDAALSRIVGELHIPVLAISGNHDSPSRLEFGSSLYASSGYYMAGQPKARTRQVSLNDAHGPVTFHLAPYLEPAVARSIFPESKIRTFDGAYEAVLAAPGNLSRDGGRHVLVAHGLFGGLGGGDRAILTSESEINVGGVDLVDSTRFAPFHYGAFGHLHAPQKAGGEHLRYSGSPLKYSVSEEHQRKTFTVVELDSKGGAILAHLPVPCRRDVRTVRGSFAQLSDKSFHTLSFDDYVFAEITDEQLVPYPMERLRSLFPHLLGLRFTALAGRDGLPIFSARKALTRLSPEELFSRFYTEIRGKDMPDAQLKILREAIEEAAKDEEETL